MSSVVQDIICAMEFAAARGLREFAHSDGKTQITLWRGAVIATPESAVDCVPPQQADSSDPATITVKAPLSGLCHLSPDPASPAFVTEGMQIRAGQSLCIVEAMKVMTAVTAPQSGTIAKIHVANGATVQSGDILIEVHP